ncbi:MAG: hypothetical protein ISS70_03600 [Phycisphaerae bacterium]|nr:hypothetical protein [Phycisphaerae bacterium]
MCNKLVYSISSVLVLVLVLTEAADANLVGYWTFDEGSGMIARDYSGQGNDGTIEGDPQWVSGRIGGALQFDGDDDQIQLKSVFTTLGSSSNTVAVWIKVPLPGTEGLDATERVGLVLGNYNDSPNSNWELHGAGQTRVWWNGGEVDHRGTTDLRDNTWHHLAWVRDKATNAIYHYIDGQLEATTANLGTDITFNTTHRIGGDNRGAPPNWHGLLDDLQVYSRALSQAEISDIMKGLFRQPASSPIPADKTIDVPRDVTLSWEPGVNADKHDVYLGTNPDDVNDASRTNPLGVLIRQGQNVNTYDPAGLLDFGQTYYWRVDEVNESPDLSIYKGEVWSFAVEPVAYPIQNVTTVASSSNSPGEGPENTVNGSGLDANDLHSAVITDMWISSITGPQPTWIQYEFDRVHKLDQMWVWNHNSLLELSFGLGVNNATIEYSVDGANWTTLGTTHEFAQAPGAAGYAANTTIDLNNVIAEYGKITANGNWGGFLPQYGLSEVRFFYVPVLAREPDPASGATDVNVDAVLSWRAGRETASHDVYLSTDEQAVIDETVSPVVSVPAGSSYASYDAGELGLGQTYYWKINEVNEAEIPATWQGDVWNFNTEEYLVVDGFEDYNDYPPDEIYSTWLDGYETPTNGSQVGHLNPPFAEPRIVHSGGQSMPFYYDNNTASYSEATANVADLVIGEDWTKHGIKTLSLWFRGDPNNSAELMYVKFNGTKVVYDGEADDITQKLWQPWNIELADFGADLVNVRQLSIGLERSGAVGGQGVVYFDDIRLYAYGRQLLTPVEPGQAGLAGHWKFDEGSGTIAHDQSGQGNDGTFQGNPKWVPGMINGALQFDGDDDQITLTDVLPIGSSSNTVALWVKVPIAGTASLAAAERVGTVLGSYPDSPNTNWEIASLGQTRLYWNGGQFNSYGTTDLRDNIWHHVAWVRDKATNACYTYIDGRLEATHPAAGADITFVTTHCIGGDNRSDPPNFHGLMDDFQIYSRALSHAEIAWLAGRTKPFDKPF